MLQQDGDQAETKISIGCRSMGERLTKDIAPMRMLRVLLDRPTAGNATSAGTGKGASWGWRAAAAGILLSALAAAAVGARAATDSSPSGQTRYVDGNNPAASDRNPCTESEPCATVQKAFSTAVAGDVWYIKRGSYDGAGKKIPLANSGAPNAWITISAYPGDEHEAVIENGTIDITERSYVKVSGLRVQNTSGQGVDILGRGASHVTVSNLYVFNAQQSCVRARGVAERKEDGAAYGYKALTDLVIENTICENTVNGGSNENITVASSVDRFEIRGNTIFHSGPVDSSHGGEGIDVKVAVSNGKIYGNEIYNINRISIYVDGGFGDGIPFPAAPLYNIEVFGNRVHHTNQGIIVRTEGRADVRGVKVYNNLIHDISGGRGPAGIALTPGGYWSEVEGKVTDVHLTNNTIYNVAGHGLVVNNELADRVIARNNLTWRTRRSVFKKATNVVVDHNLEGVDPLFVDAEAGDFRLQSDSPAIDAGAPTDAPAADFGGASRRNGEALDVGAYEFALPR